MEKIKKTAVTATIVMVLAFNMFVPVQAANSEVQGAQTPEEVLLDNINCMRSGIHVHALTEDAALDSYAAVRAKEASAKWSHTRPDGTAGMDIVPNQKCCGENLSQSSGCYSESAKENAMFVAMCNSPEHYVNMADSNFSKIGIGHYYDGDRLVMAYLFE